MPMRPSSARPIGYRPLLLSGGLHAAAARRPGKVALIVEGKARNYADLSARVSRIAGGLHAAGMTRGDRIAICAPNCLEYAELVCGIADAGMIAVTLSPRLTAREFIESLTDCGARWVFAHPDCLAQVSSAVNVAAIRVMEFGEEYEVWQAHANPTPPLPDLEETEAFTLVYSSGTTGRPKGIVISHRSRTLTFHGMAMEYGCYGPDDFQLGIAPMSHGAGFAFIMATLYFGGTVDILPRFDPELTLRRLAEGHFTGVFMVPAHFQAIFSLPPATLHRWKTGSTALRTIISNASALPQSIKERIVDYWGPGKLHETYGSTEGGIVTNLRPEDQLSRLHSVGPAFALNEIRLLGPDGTEVAAGEVGELFSRSPYVFNGYFEKPEETAEVFREGWVSAGDLARKDEDGYLYIVDRKKDMVITGGFNVYPREVEEQLLQHPAILEAAVIGIPDERWGESIQAFYVLRTGKNVNQEELDSHCRKTLAGFKVPKNFHEIGALPRNTGGKILKTALRTQLERHTGQTS